MQRKITRHGKDLRVGRWSHTGHVYHITTATRHRRRVFAELYAARAVIASLSHADDAGETRTLAFVLMPDHLHWLLELRRGSLAAVVGGMKSSSAHRLGRPVWQPGYHDHALRRDEDLRTVARYIIANPLRAGLVERVGDYPHWDAIWL